MPIRPPSKVCIAILNPIPGWPKRLVLGMTQSSMMTLEVEEARIPNFSSFLPKDNPGASRGTIKALIPLCFLDLSVVAKTTKQPAVKIV